MARTWSIAACLLLALLLALSSRASSAERVEDEAASLAAEEAVSAVIDDAVEAEEEDDADAMDEDADASRFNPNDPDRHPLTNMPPSSKDVEIGYAFASNLSPGKLTLGKKVRVIIGFANNARVAFHIWGVMGSLNMPHNFAVHVQNLSYSLVNHTVPAAHELSLDYEFEPNERLDTRQFLLALSIFYEARNLKGNVIRAHATTFFNQTVVTETGPQAVNNTAFIAIILLAVGAAVGAVLYSKSKSESDKRSKVELGTTSNATEWLEDHNSMLRGGGRSKSKTK